MVLGMTCFSWGGKVELYSPEWSCDAQNMSLIDRGQWCRQTLTRASSVVLAPIPYREVGKCLLRFPLMSCVNEKDKKLLKMLLKKINKKTIKNDQKE